MPVCRRKERSCKTHNKRKGGERELVKERRGGETEGECAGRGEGGGVGEREERETNKVVDVLL